MEYRNAHYADAAQSAIDLEINHPVHGWIPFTARPDDPEQIGRDLFTQAAAGDVAAYEPPAPAPVTGASVNAEHDRRVLAGKTFTLAGYGDVPLEGSARTQIVLLALDRNAERLKDQGVTDPVLMLTDRDNTDHYLTPDQIISLVSLGTAWMQEMHDAKRTLKEMEPIPADYASDTHWPD